MLAGPTGESGRPGLALLAQANLQLVPVDAARAVLAGTGVTPGTNCGRSDKQAAYPLADPVTPGDLSATLFHALGIPSDTHYEDFTARPSQIVTGTPVTKLFS